MFGTAAAFLVCKQLHGASNRLTDATVNIDTWVVTSAAYDFDLTAGDYTLADGNRGGHRASSMVGLYQSVAKSRAYLLRPVGSSARKKTRFERWQIPS